MNVDARPRLSAVQAAGLAERLYGIAGMATELPGERDCNFRLDTPAGEAFVLKIAHPGERPEVLDLQTRALRHLAGGEQPELFPRVRPSVTDAASPTVRLDYREHLVRLVTWVAGTPIAAITTRPDSLLTAIGARLGVMDRELAAFAHPAMHHAFHWDSKHAFEVLPAYADDIAGATRRDLVLGLLAGIRDRIMPRLPALALQVIHNDVNDHNLLVDERGRVSGIIDFGDMVHTYRVCEPANAIAYLMLDADDPAAVARLVADGYASTSPLAPEERATLADFVTLRLCLSVAIASRQRRQDPDNAYLGVSETQAWAMLERLAGGALESIADACGGSDPPSRTIPELVEARHATLSGTLSTSYRRPLKIVRGRGANLFDEDDRRYLDCVNNVCHVGHCHPRVVAAGQMQMARLNTNTRYLHDNIVEYARRLGALLPDPLSVCFFVNSGSEANDLALRLARAHTGATDLVVVDGSYHGHLQSLIEVSPYKYDGRGGHGPPPTTHALPVPDRLRGPHRYDDPDAGVRYATEAGERITRIADARPLAGFLAESILGVAGQVEFPPGYLAGIYPRVRDAGGVCIADEVQVGFGRVGTHTWGFQTHDVVPDIVTLGKPIGNGHPLGAVVTTPEVARSFETGMEYFNTFGGNPVSCAIGLAVLDVIESEGLQAHARVVGEHFIGRLRQLAATRPLIGDVRGRGLFLGIELVRDRATLEPATAEAAEIVERMKDRGILLSTDGPYNAVVKIKPPLVFDRRDADHVVDTLDEVLGEDLSCPSP